MPPFYSALKNALTQVRAEHPFTVDTFVLLPDHLHCIWTLPLGDANYALRWNLIKRLVSQATRQLVEASTSCSRQQRRELGLWQRRFWEHQIRDEQDLVKHVEYIHWNPVKHGCVARVRDWPYSSFHRYVRQGLYPLDWASGDETNDAAEDDYGEPQSSCA
jgi:putative transposase